MSEPFLGEVKMMSFNFPPKGWAFCNGQLLPINQNQALFTLLGTTYGGDGRVNFALPNLQARTPVHAGNGIVLGEKGGEQTHTLNISEMPTHIHFPVGNSGTATTGDPTGAVWAAAGVSNFSSAAPNVTMNAATVGNVGGSQPHQNMPPYLVLNFCIALLGIFPSQN